eukprot:TRINITY_DN60673_c0_g1_i1.p1 TRINITY_DN60673_c0_g1~~TRINITY_DN60673_c0_g1_i1.p1  ORF type:complete len:294 (-),score=49.09 TRINITY_DN60673_c0_g1_i1:168-1049(-)
MAFFRVSQLKVDSCVRVASAVFGFSIASAYRTKGCCEQEQSLSKSTADTRLAALGSCACRPTGTGRGLIALTHLNAGEVVFKERAIVDSNCPTDVMERTFDDPACRKDPIWGLVASYIAAKTCDTQLPGRSPPVILDGFYRATATMQSSYEEHARHIHGAMKEEMKSFADVEELKDLLMVTRLDAHNITIARELAPQNLIRLPPVGLGLFYALHIANHSCSPNAFFTASCVAGQSSPAEMTLRALRTIRPGEEICISYVDGSTLFQSCVQRKATLEKTFGFVCKCPRCLSEGI